MRITPPMVRTVVVLAGAALALTACTAKTNPPAPVPAPAAATTNTPPVADPLAGTLWMVTADAPYAPHMFVFNADGTMISTNPTNVQEKKDGSGVHDSIGIGLWKLRADGSYDIDFWELNANQTRNPKTDKAVPADTLEVRATIQLNGDKFTSSKAGVFFGGKLAGPTSVKGTLAVLTPMK